MSDLAELQRFMAQALRCRSRLTTNPELARRAAEHFSGSARLSPVEQLEIYREQFWFRHTAALLEDYPGLSGIVGQGAWERLSEEYLSQSPFTGFSLRDVGKGLPEFVRDQALWLEPHALCVDMARLEWVYVELFDAADAGTLDPARLLEIADDWEHSRLRLCPALRLLRVGYPVVELRKRLRTAGDSAVPIPDAQPACLLLYRRDLELVHETLEPAAFVLLDALAAGLSLGAACERARAVGAPGALVDAQVTGWFADWVRKGLIVDAARQSDA